MDIVALDTKEIAGPAAVKAVWKAERIGQEQFTLSPESVCWTESNQLMIPFSKTS